MDPPGQTAAALADAVEMAGEILIASGLLVR